MSLEESGHASLIRDLLRLHRTFSFRRYRIDVLGFVLAWGLVFSFLAFLWWMSGWGKAENAAALPIQPVQSGQYSRTMLPGKLLVAHRDLPDPNFAETVILVMHYDETGAMGLIINRQTTVPLKRALREFVSAQERSDPVYLGGPVSRTGARALARSATAPAEARHIFADIYVVTGKESLEALLGSAKSGPQTLRVYFGYAGWAPGQLESEIDAGMWHVLGGDPAVVFDLDPASVWSRMIERTEVHVAHANAAGSAACLSFSGRG
jgi:putative transcriptional regulator